MTKHPCTGMTAAERRNFELIATNQRPRGHITGLKHLLERGLIEDAGYKLIGRDRFGDIFMPEWRVPLAYHAQWCQWASERPDTDR